MRRRFETALERSRIFGNHIPRVLIVGEYDLAAMLSSKPLKPLVRRVYDSGNHIAAARVTVG
jgi:hypothetical protein